MLSVALSSPPFCRPPHVLSREYRGLHALQLLIFVHMVRFFHRSSDSCGTGVKNMQDVKHQRQKQWDMLLIWECIDAAEQIREPNHANICYISLERSLPNCGSQLST